MTMGQTYNVSFRGIAGALAALAILPAAMAGPYSAPANNPSNTYDAPIPGFIGPHGEGMARLEMVDIDYNIMIENPANFVNPVFAAWADELVEYSPAPGVGAGWNDASLTLGPVTGDVFDVATLGDLSSTQVTGGIEPGRVTVRLARPVGNLPGADFAVFENGFAADNSSATDGSVAGQFSADLAYVEVSSDGITFARFPSHSLTNSRVGKYGTLTASNVFNLAGKHANSYGRSWGTPFDLTGLATDPLVTSGQVDLDAIQFIRLVDIPGTGQFFDSTGRPIYDPSVTEGSGGFDLEAVGAISVPMTLAAWQAARDWPPGKEGAQADADGDGVANVIEAALGRDPLRPDLSPPTAIIPAAGRHAFTFTRDTRMTDLTIEVAASSDLVHWEVIARSSAGGPLLPVAPFAPLLENVSASPIQSIGVIRRHTVRNVLSSSSTPGFFRLNIVPPAP